MLGAGAALPQGMLPTHLWAPPPCPGPPPRPAAGTARRRRAGTAPPCCAAAPSAWRPRPWGRTAGAAGSTGQSAWRRGGTLRRSRGCGSLPERACCRVRGRAGLRWLLRAGLPGWRRRRRWRWRWRRRRQPPVEERAPGRAAAGRAPWSPPWLQLGAGSARLGGLPRAGRGGVAGGGEARGRTSRWGAGTTAVAKTMPQGLQGALPSPVSSRPPAGRCSSHLQARPGLQPHAGTPTSTSQVPLRPRSAPTRR